MLNRFQSGSRNADESCPPLAPHLLSHGVKDLVGIQAAIVITSLLCLHAICGISLTSMWLTSAGDSTEGPAGCGRCQSACGRLAKDCRKSIFEMQMPGGLKMLNFELSK